MDNLVLFFCFLLGIFVGSFLNVVILRMRTGLPISNGRSMCFACGKTLGFFELIPLLSFILSKGRCRKCSAKISWQYPIVELITGLLFLAIGYISLSLSGLEQFIFAIYSAIVFSTFVVIAVYDLRHKIIPDECIIVLAIIGLLMSLYQGLITGSIVLHLLSSVLSGLVLFLPFYILWLVSKGRWIGLGDGKLALVMGIILPFESALSGIAIAFWVGAIFGIVLIILQKSLGKRFSMKSEIPFAPFLILGFLIVYFFPMDLFNVSLIYEYLF